MKTILIVDDEESMRESMKLMLDSEFEIIEAENGTMALDLAMEHEPDLIISDVVMDNGNGFLLRELLKEDPRTSSIPIILTTGYVQDKGAWESDPEVRYLEKPFAASALMAIVKELTA